MESWVVTAAVVVAGLSLLFLIWSTVRHIQNEHSKGRGVWREFGLGLALMTLFFSTWVAHGFVEWQRYSNGQEEHNQPVEVSGFITEFSAATLENWQSEFLQLFAFVALAGLYVYKGSAESKDGEERLEASLRRIEQHLGTLPPDAPVEPGQEWKLPDTAMQAGG